MRTGQGVDLIDSLKEAGRRGGVRARGQVRLFGAVPADALRILPRRLPRAGPWQLPLEDRRFAAAGPQRARLDRPILVKLVEQPERHPRVQS